MGLANLMGGRMAYADKLDYAFENSAPFDFIGAYGQGYVSYGNQPGLQMAHLFNYVGYPWLTQYWVRQVKQQTYGSISTTDGYGHHDEDQGQMGAMSALMAIGPVRSDGRRATSAPCTTSPRRSLTRSRSSSTGATTTATEFRIVTHDNSAENMYVQRARLDGDNLNNAWLRHDALADGGTLELWLGAEPNKHWGVDELPPSESAEHRAGIRDRRRRSPAPPH